MPHTRLRGHVADDVDAADGENAAERVVIADINLMKCEVPVFFKNRKACLLERRVVVGVEVVYAGDAFARCAQLLCHMEPDEASRPGYQNHGTILSPDNNIHIRIEVRINDCSGSADFIYILDVFSKKIRLKGTHHVSRS